LQKIVRSGLSYQGSLTNQEKVLDCFDEIENTMDDIFDLANITSVLDEKSFWEITQEKSDTISDKKNVLSFINRENLNSLG
jgi:hypothetical protein